MIHGGDFGVVPRFYLDLIGAAKAGVPWLEFEAYPLWRKNAVFAALAAENKARIELQKS